MRAAPVTIGAITVALAAIGALWAESAVPQPHNVVLFVADGLRSGIVTDQTAPELAALRAEGVDFHNSHSLYPTITTPNASAIATGHRIGDTGDFGNSLYVGPQPLAAPIGAVTSPVENDAALTLLNERYGGNFLSEQSLLAAARTQGYSTAAIGKLGPISIQDVTQREGSGTIVIDDATGTKAPSGIPLAPEIAEAIKAAGLDVVAAARGSNGETGTYNKPGTLSANTGQQDWFARIATDVILPRFKATRRPFVLVFWSRDPDGSQHNQGDSLNQLQPGINGPTAMAGIRNASSDLGRLRAALKRLGLDKTTDVVVTADHGFSTASKQSATSAAAKLAYGDVPPGFLPSGFLAIDLGLGLDLPIWSPLRAPIAPKTGAHPPGSALLGADPDHPDVVVAANGGSDLIYLPNGNAKALAAKIAGLLINEDYTGGLFVDDALGPIAGTLPMSKVGLVGSARTPRPAIYVGFRNYAGRCARPDTCQIEVADTELQQGQGIHGTFGRGDTHNFMAAVGPDFKAGFVDPAPVSNADLAPTLARLLGLKLAPKGKLVGRVIGESLKGGKAVGFIAKSVRSDPAANGFVTRLNYQMVGQTPYFDAAGMPGRALGVN